EKGKCALWILGFLERYIVSKISPLCRHKFLREGSSQSAFHQCN
uniref:Uncharacterized protein n=1 Tax=Aegilops tauschii subsp. strangulata TaxID=200361 RepID=A0A453N4A7_AEGTS